MHTTKITHTNHLLHIQSMVSSSCHYYVSILLQRRLPQMASRGELHYCNELYTNLPANQLNRLQSSRGLSWRGGNIQPVLA